MAQLIGGLRRCRSRHKLDQGGHTRCKRAERGPDRKPRRFRARLQATIHNEVDISDREGLIRRAKELSTSGIISLKENECQALRRLTIPIFEFADKRNKTERSLLCPLPFLEPPVSEKIN